MASILRVNTLTDASSGNSIATSVLHNGITRTWASFDGTAAGATIGDSFNVSSIADDGTGTYTITINNDMANADYCTTSGVGRGGLATCTFLNDGTWAATAGSGQVICANSSNAAFDPPAVLASFLGDLA